MPTLKKLCSAPSCSGVAKRGRNFCDACAAAKDQIRRERGLARLRRLGKAADKKRANARSRGYDRRWQKLRKIYLARHPFCIKCPRLATEVDHILPLAEGGTHADDNLQALCKSCHSRKTIRDNRGADGRIGGRRLMREQESFEMK